MPQLTIGQRIKFLLDSQGGSIRKFARLLDVSDTNIRNYIERGTKPSSDTLEKLLQIIPHLNPIWLLTGEGDAFLLQPGESAQIGATTVKNNSGNSIGINHGRASQQQGAGPASTEAELLLKIQHLEAQLAMKDQVIASKEETIDLLKAAYGRPN
jgi:transcriptional regulator with XRE-family HTH domain